MTKKEKIAALTLVFAMFLMTASSIFTLYQNKPEGYQFRIEKIIKKL